MKIVFAKMHDTAKHLALTGNQYPVNIGYLAQICLDADYEVEMWDFSIEPFDHDSLIEKIKKSNPDILGVSCVTAAMYFGHELCTVAKYVNEDILTLVGGVHITALPYETMEEFGNFDLGVLREAEDTILGICEAVDNGNIRPTGLTATIYRDGNKLAMGPAEKEFPDVNKIPYPNRDLVPMSWYTEKHSSRGVSRNVWNLVELHTSRGCPFACTFCNVELTHGRQVRFRTPEHVHGEIEACVKKYDTNFVMFNDSTFTIRKDRAIEIVEGLPGLGIEAYLANAHVNTVDAEMLDAFARTGCYKLSFGVESGSDRVLKAIKKNSTQARIREAFKIAKRSGIPQIEATFILGADPMETEEDMMLTEALISELQPDIVGLGTIVPFPGTNQYTELKKLGLLGDLRWDEYQLFTEDPPPWRIVNFSAEELMARRNRILKNYIWTPQYVFKQFRKVRSFEELKYYAKMAKTFYKVVVRKSV